MLENLFIIDLAYQAPLEKLDEAMKAHVNSLKNTTKPATSSPREGKFHVQAE